MHPLVLSSQQGWGGGLGIDPSPIMADGGVLTSAREFVTQQVLGKAEGLDKLGVRVPTTKIRRYVDKTVGMLKLFCY
jgi:hypothetical protein